MDDSVKHIEKKNFNEKLHQDNVLNKSSSSIHEDVGEVNKDAQKTLDSLNLGDSDVEQKKISLLRAKAYTLLAQLKFEEAAKPLEEIFTIHGSPGFDTSLLKAECFLQLGRETKALKAIDDVKKSLLTHPTLDVGDVINLANDFAENSSFIRAIILLRVASDMYQQFVTSDNEVLHGIYNCITKSHNIVGTMIQAGDRLRVIAVDFGIEYMTEMLESLRSIKNVYMEKKILLEAWCVNYVGYNYCTVKENVKGVNTRRSGAEVLERHFCENVHKYRVYGVLLHNVGVGYFNMDKFTEAEKYYSKAIEAKTNALDYDSEKDQKDDVQISENGLIETVKKL